MAVLCPSHNAEEVAHSIIAWCSAFGLSAGMMSDSLTHFRSEALRRISKGLGSPHHLTQPYCPLINRAVERIVREFLGVARAVSLELQLPSRFWPDIIPLI